MPYEVRKQDERYCVYKEGESEPLGCHDSAERAKRQIEAIYASESDTKAEMHRYTYNGVSCQASRRRASTRDDKKYMRDVSYNGSERVVHYGDPNMDMQRDNEERRANFLARHSCSDKKDPFAPGFWACLDWQRTDEKAIDMDMNIDETIVYYGGAVKALGDGKVGGYLVRFGDNTKTDLEGEFFTKDTDFGRFEDTDIYYHHGLDSKLKRRVIGNGKLRKDELGVWVEAQLNLRDEYERAIYGMIESGKQGWSSGTASHLVEREPAGKATFIKRWVLGLDASITPTPAEPRNNVVSLKSLINNTSDDAELSEAQTADAPTGAPSVAHDAESNDVDIKSNIQILDIGDNQMSENQQPETPTPASNPMDELLAKIDAKFAQAEQRTSAAISGVLDAMESNPKLNRQGYFSVDGGTADANLKSAPDFLLAIRRQDTKRLSNVYGVKAQTEGTGTTGGYLVPDEVLNDLLGQITMTSGIAQLVTRIRVNAPAGEMPIRDYSRTPTANAGNSASASGIESQLRSEGGAYAAETMYFEQLVYRVTDAASGHVRASRELSEDYPAIQGILASAIQEDVANKEEFFILRGSGVGQPLGILNWGGTIGVNEGTDNTFVVADADNMLSRLLMVGGARIAWVHSPNVIPSINQFERGTGGAVYQSNIPGALPQSLFGYPRFVSQHLPQIGTDGYAVLGDFSKYFMFERGGLYIDFSEHADFLNGNDTWRFGKRCDGKPAMTSSVTLADGSFTQSPFVIINNLS